MRSRGVMISETRREPNANTLSINSRSAGATWPERSLAMSSALNSLSESGAVGGDSSGTKSRANGWKVNATAASGRAVSRATAAGKPSAKVLGVMSLTSSTSTNITGTEIHPPGGPSQVSRKVVARHSAKTLTVSLNPMITISDSSGRRSNESTAFAAASPRLARVCCIRASANSAVSDAASKALTPSSTMTTSNSIVDNSIAYPPGRERNWSHPASGGAPPRTEPRASSSTAVPEEVMRPIRLTRTPRRRVSAGAATAWRRQNSSS